MKIKITAIIAMVMLLGLFVSVFAFAGTINYTYDNAGRLTGTDYGSSKTITFTYDNNGNLLTREVETPVTQYTITTSADPVAGGTVTGGGTYDEDEQVTVEATANADYSFTNWTEGGTEVSTIAAYTFPATADRTLVANFTENQKYTIAVSAAPAAGGTVSGGGTYDEGAQVTVKAAANADYSFINWSQGGTEVSTTAEHTFTATADRTLVANFNQNPQQTFTVSVSAAPAAGGTVSGGGIYDEGAQVTVKAAANVDYNFINWSQGGTEVSTTAEYTFTATADRTLVANFNKNPQQTFTVSVSVSPATGGYVTGNGINCPAECTKDYDENTEIQLTAIPTDGNQFLRWEGDLTGIVNPGVVTMDTNKQVTAYFGPTSATDIDIDGVSDETESGPDGNDSSYDGDGNGVPDYQEPGVVSLPSTSGGAYVTIAVADASGQVLSDVQARENPSPQDSPAKNEFPYGFFSFSIENLNNPGERATTTLYLPKNTSLNTYYQYGPTPDNPTDHWYEFMYNGDTGAEIFHEDSQTRIVLYLIDGGRGDRDITANGRIDDPGAPGTFSKATSDSGSGSGCFINSI